MNFSGRFGNRRRQQKAADRRSQGGTGREEDSAIIWMLHSRTNGFSLGKGVSTERVL